MGVLVIAASLFDLAVTRLGPPAPGQLRVTVLAIAPLMIGTVSFIRPRPAAALAWKRTRVWLWFVAAGAVVGGAALAHVWPLGPAFMAFVPGGLSLVDAARSRIAA